MENRKSESIRSFFGKNFIGVDELLKIHQQIGIVNPEKWKGPIPEIPFAIEEIKKFSVTHILVLIIPETTTGGAVSLLSLRRFFGVDPDKQEPCLYNQDWYLNEEFASISPQAQWVLIRKEIEDKTRGMVPEQIRQQDPSAAKLPSAIICAYIFFAYYFHTNGEKLWNYDYIWCSDIDAAGDRIYVGRYTDPAKLNKNGFSIHRHLSIKKNYGACTLV